MPASTDSLTRRGSETQSSRVTPAGNGYAKAACAVPIGTIRGRWLAS